MRSVRVPLFLFLFTITVCRVQGGLVLESTEQAEGAAATSTRLYLDSAGLRAESPDNIMVFRSDKQVLWIIDRPHKEYREMTESDVARMGSKMDEAMKKMKEQMAQLPPEQRAMVEEMMKKQLPGGFPGADSVQAAPKPVKTYEKTGISEKVGVWTCDKYTEKENGEKVGEIWTVPASTFATFTQYFSMLRKLGNFFSKMPMAQGKAMEFPMMKASGEEEDAGLSGIPVKDIRYREDGSVASQWELKKVSEESVEPTLFEVPPGFQKHALMEESH